MKKVAYLTALSLAVTIATPGLAQEANFNNLVVSAGSGTATGTTGGSYSLGSISNTDRYNRPCLGFASPKPDHIMVLDQNYRSFTIRVNTRGGDTTLLVKGPDNKILCGDDTGNSKDASVTETNLKAGKYQVWVGTLEAKRRLDYTVSVQATP